MPNFLSDDELRAELEAAERRKEEDLKSKSRIVSLILCVPTLILLGAAGIFLLRYQTPSPTIVKKPARTAPVAPAPPAQGKIIDKSDLEFATRLLNFGNAADAPPAKR